MSASSKPSGEAMAPVIGAAPLAPRQRGAAAGSSLVLNIVSCLILVVFLGSLMIIVPRFERIYGAFNAELPSLTIWVLDASGLVCSWWMLVLPAAAAAMAGLVCLSVFGRGGIREFVAVVVLVLVASLEVLVFVGVWMPLPGLIEAVQV